MATVEVDVGSTQARFEKSDYAQVVFHNIAETYPTDANVDCHYTITSYLMPSSRDWVGLYKVGWSSSREYVYFEWSPKSADYKPGLDNELHIMFRGLFINVMFFVSFQTHKNLKVLHYSF